MTEKKHQPRKRFGQNFLHDSNIIARIVSAIAPKADDVMVEIGPGQGALTTQLLDRLNALHAVELDRDLIPLLNTMFATKALTLHEADALQFDFSQLMQGKAIRIVGNLPYNISTPLIFHLLSYKEQVRDMHFMLQLEVVDRLAAAPGSKIYGKLSVVAQYYYQVDKLFNVPAAAFNPPPKVMSAIVKLTPCQHAIMANDEKLFERIVKISFSQRRKTLRNNLKQLLSSEQLGALDQDLTQRPEQLSLDDYIRLSNSIEQLL